VRGFRVRTPAMFLGLDRAYFEVWALFLGAACAPARLTTLKHGVKG
jgi:hypothetical protein